MSEKLPTLPAPTLSTRCRSRLTFTISSGADNGTSGHCPSAWLMVRDQPEGHRVTTTWSLPPMQLTAMVKARRDQEVVVQHHSNEDAALAVSDTMDTDAAPTK